MHTDPSGHECIPGSDICSQDDDSEYNDPDLSHKDKPHNTKHGYSNPPEGPNPGEPLTDGYPTGDELYEWYMDLWRNKSGWWWDVFGADGYFTFNEAMIIILSGELMFHYGAVPPNIIAMVLVRKANATCIDQYHHACSEAEFVHWFASWAQSGRGRIFNGTDGGNFFAPGWAAEGTEGWFYQIMDWVQNPDEDWLTGKSDFEAFDWADTDLDKIKDNWTYIKSNPNTYTYIATWTDEDGNQQGFVIYNGCLDTAFHNGGGEDAIILACGSP
jgi:hypothetical protein